MTTTIILNNMTIQHHKNNNTMPLSSQELQEVRDMSHRLRQLKRQMFLKQVEMPSSIHSFRSLIINLAIEEEAKEAFRSRCTSSRSSSFDNPFISDNDSFSSIKDLHDD